MRRSRGFTLIEVMITVAIVAILSAIALPAYKDYVTRARITEGVAQLSGMRIRMEQFFQDNRTYNNACVAPSIAYPPPGQYFKVTCAYPNGGANYTLTAQGVGIMLEFAYTLNDANQRTTAQVPADWSIPATNNCWVIKKGGLCLE